MDVEDFIDCTSNINKWKIRGATYNHIDGYAVLILGRGKRRVRVQVTAFTEINA